MSLKSIKNQNSSSNHGSPTNKPKNPTLLRKDSSQRGFFNPSNEPVNPPSSKKVTGQFFNKRSSNGGSGAHIPAIVSQLPTNMNQAKPYISKHQLQVSPS